MWTHAIPVGQRAQYTFLCRYRGPIVGCQEIFVTKPSVSDFRPVTRTLIFAGSSRFLQGSDHCD